METPILSLLQEQTALYQRLKQLAGEQLSKIEEDDLPGFAEATDLRNSIQENISSLDSRVGSLIGSSPGTGKAPRVKEMRESIQTAAQEILALDQKTTALIREKRDQAARSLEHLKEGRRGVRGYGGSSPSPQPRFIDQEG